MDAITKSVIEGYGAFAIEQDVRIPNRGLYDTANSFTSEQLLSPQTGHFSIFRRRPVLRRSGH
jgi:hypothetical protein